MQTVPVGPSSVHNLSVWRKTVRLVREVYEVTRGWPNQEMYSLTAQLKRAAVSVPANIAEGVGRGTSAEIARFSQIAIGSLYELDTLLEVAAQVGLPITDGRVRKDITELIRMMCSFSQYHRRVHT